jgi:hypothetical protein
VCISQFFRLDSAQCRLILKGMEELLKIVALSAALMAGCYVLAYGVATLIL